MDFITLMLAGLLLIAAAAGARPATAEATDKDDAEEAAKQRR